MKKLETKQAILTAAKTLFIANGYKGTTTAQIAKSTGISEMTLFRHFAKKEDIFQLVIHPVVSFLDQLSVPSHDQLQQTVKELLQNRLLFLLEEKDLVRLVLMESYTGDALNNPITEVVTKLTAHFTALPQNDCQLLIRLIAGFILTEIFLPKSKISAKERMEDFLHLVVYPLLERFTQQED